MITNNKLYISSSIILLAIITFFAVYHLVIKVKEQEIIKQEYKSEAADISADIESLVLSKEKATLGIAISLASDVQMQKYLQEGEIPHNYYDMLVRMYHKNTLYKNIWIQIVDKYGRSLHRSWAEDHHDNVAQRRSDIKRIEKSHKVTYSIGVGNYDLSIRAIVPIFSDKQFLGVLEVISHFNSISRLLKRDSIESVVVATKEETSHLKHPFTKLFVDGYYVANLDAPLEARKLLSEYGLDALVTKRYAVYKNRFIVIKPLKDINQKIIGYYIVLKDLNSLSHKALSHFRFQWMVITLLIFMALAGVINITLYFMMRKQKRYYKNIIDASNNIMLVNDKKKILEANKTFFQYFKKYKNVEEFRKENKCICKYFVQEEGYLARGTVSYGWLEYVIKNQDETHKVKMEIDGEVFYFLVNVALISQEDEHYSVVFSDITKEEEYKKELEILNTKDALTNVYNRRYYESTIEKEMYNAKRYGYSLSVIMFDIDFFKRVNDEHGHSVGDEVLVFYSHLIGETLRESDALCRVGGEEFVIILPHTNGAEAYKTAEKLRVLVQESTKVLPITISCGVTEYISGESKDYLYKRADDALYEAKESGRNRVVVK